MLRFSDARNFGRTFTGLLLIAGPLLMLLAQIAAPDEEWDAPRAAAPAAPIAVAEPIPAV